MELLSKYWTLHREKKRQQALTKLNQEINKTRDMARISMVQAHKTDDAIKKDQLNKETTKLLNELSDLKNKRSRILLGEEIPLFI
jgi:hypothetical protein